MIDLHCHFLPGVDDGAADADEALALARASLAQGIGVAVLTPHLHPGRYSAGRGRLRAVFEDYVRLLAAHGVGLELRLACEMRVCAETVALLRAGQVSFVGRVGSARVLLVEFPHDRLPPGSLELMRHLVSQGIRPLIAHPERNRAVMRQPELIRPFVDAGCWLQLTAASVTGEFGAAAQATARYLVEEDLAWVLATDAHNMKHRPPCLAEGRAVLAEWVGDAIARRMVSDRPAQILGLVRKGTDLAAGHARVAGSEPPLRAAPMRLQAVRAHG